MKLVYSFLIPALLAGLTSCRTTRTGVAGKDDGIIETVFVQVNDVYEIAPLAGGAVGGMARVATLKNQYKQKNPNTLLVMAGDFLSPSVYNSLQYEGKRIRGRQMVDAMNAAATDLVVLGNHEFDLSESELLDRINESDFQWISSNAFHKTEGGVVPFQKNMSTVNQPFPQTLIVPVTDSDGTTAKIGFIGITLPFNQAGYVHYTDPLHTAKELYNRIKDSVDAVVAITHQAVRDDSILARELPNLAIILGGHEHDQRFLKVGDVYITKAHANARSAYIVTLRINKRKNKVQAIPKLHYINESIPFDSATQTVVQKWTRIAQEKFSEAGFDAQKTLLADSDPLDGREISVRSQPTNLTRLIVSAIAAAAPKADVVLLNGGSIRVDDILPMPVTQYDLIRALPFGGSIREVEMKGSLLLQVLDQGQKNRGEGGFLHFNEAVQFNEAANVWTIAGKSIDSAAVYRVALPEFLLSGKESNLGYLNPQNPAVVKVYDAETSTAQPLSDIRLTVVHYLEKK